MRTTGPFCNGYLSLRQIGLTLYRGRAGPVKRINALIPPAKNRWVLWHQFFCSTSDGAASLDGRVDRLSKHILPLEGSIVSGLTPTVMECQGLSPIYPVATLERRP
jgi:hypothetical protein